MELRGIYIIIAASLKFASFDMDKSGILSVSMFKFGFAVLL